MALCRASLLVTVRASSSSGPPGWSSSSRREPCNSPPRHGWPLRLLCHSGIGSTGSSKPLNLDLNPGAGKAWHLRTLCSRGEWAQPRPAGSGHTRGEAHLGPVTEDRRQIRSTGGKQQKGCGRGRARINASLCSAPSSLGRRAYVAQISRIEAATGTGSTDGALPLSLPEWLHHCLP